MDAQVAQLRQQARQAFDARDYGNALALFNAILAQHPRFADIRHYAGLCHSFLGDPEAALEQFDYALASNPGYVEAHINRALTLNELGKFTEAREAFDLAAHFEQEVTGQFPAAVTAKLANGHAALGDLYFDAGALHQAADEYQRALQLRSRFHDIRNKLAQTLLQLGDVHEAMNELRTVLDANPRFLAARLNIGLAFYRLGQPDRARMEWELARSQDPDNAQVRAYLALLRQTEAPSEA